MRFGSVCSGIEAASVAWRPLGWTPVFYSEIEPFPCAVLAHHEPDVPNFGDMTRFQEWPDATIDVLVGGTPCQAFSVAGLRKGLADPRGNLTLTYLAVAARYRPEWLVWENVPGVLSDREAFGAFLGGLSKLGYGWAYRVLDAQFFGLAQRRKRVFVVASARGWQRAAAVLLEPASLSGNPPPSREARERVARPIAAGSPGGSGYRNDADTADNLVETDGREIARCVTTGEGTRQDYETTPLVAHALRAEGFDASEDGTGRGTPIVPIAFDTTQITSVANRSNPKPGDPCHPLAAGAHAPTIAFDSRQDCVSSTELFGALGSSSPQAQAVAQSMAVRRLTPRECERLQGFPDDYTRIPLRNVKGKLNGKWAKDGPRYKALGNSMAVPCMRWIGARLATVHAAVAEKEIA